jgi:hypothetical protein
VAEVSPWATVADYVKSNVVPQWVDGEDKLRVGAYDLYDAIFWTAPESFQITMRGQEGDPIYVPSGRQIVETAHRYIAPSMSVVTDPGAGNETQRNDAQLFFNDFAARERFYSKFSSNKLNGIKRGDWLWHIFADPERPDGAKVSIFPLNPANYFPEFADGDDITRLIAVHIAEPIFENDKTFIHKTIYRKLNEDGGPSPISVQEIVCPVDEWGQPGTDMGIKVTRTIADEAELPSEIDAIPVYHVPNVYDPEYYWGSSEMRGVERLMGGINQAITDEELVLVFDGLGVWVTDAGAPVDEEGNEQPWVLAPARVVELPGGTFLKRESGVQTVTPFMDHLKYLHSQLDQTTGANDITRGVADVAVAESGIALALRMGPLLARMNEKELVVTDVTNQMLFDLRKWFMAYEDEVDGLEDIRWQVKYGEKLPINRSVVFNQIMAMYTAVPPIVSGEEARRLLRDIGFDFTDEAQLAGQIQRDQVAAADALAARINTEAGGAI